MAKQEGAGINDSDRVQTRRRHLYLCLLALALPGTDQIALFPPDEWIRRPDELAEEYDTAMGRLRHVSYSDVPPAMVQQLDEVDRLLDKMSDDKSLWSNEALMERSEWERVRQLAKAALEGGEWPDVPASDLQYVFGQPADESVFDRVAGRLSDK